MATYSKLRSDDPQVQQARQRAGRIVNAMSELAALVQEAWDSGDHRTLGYDTWQSYTIGEFGHGDTAIKARQVIVAMLRGTGLSQRAIAAQTGASTGTIHNDIADLTAEPPEGDPATRDRRTTAQPVEQTATVTGLDGRVRPATRGGMSSDERRARRRERDEIRRQEELEAQREALRNRLRAPAGNLTPAELEENHRHAGRDESAAARYVAALPDARGVFAGFLDPETAPEPRRGDTEILLAAQLNVKLRQWLTGLRDDQLDAAEEDWEGLMTVALAAIASRLTAKERNN